MQLKARGEVTARVLLQELQEEKPCVSSNGGKEEEKMELFKNLFPKKCRVKKLQ